MSKTKKPTPETLMRALDSKYGELTVFVDIDKFKSELETDESTLNEDMLRQSGYTAYYGMQVSAAKRQLSQVKLAVQTNTAKISKRVKQELEDAGERGTVSQIEAEVDTDPLVIAWRMRQMDAEEIYEIARVAYDAFKYRREMLTGIGNMKRAEMRGDMSQQAIDERIMNHEQRRKSARERLADAKRERTSKE